MEWVLFQKKRNSKLKPQKAQKKHKICSLKLICNFCAFCGSKKAHI